MQKILKTIIVIFLILFCSGCLLRDNLEKENIFEVVQENKKVILQDIKNNNYKQTLKINGIKEINPKTEDGYIEFYCGGVGIGSNTGYYGFYYSTSNEVNGLWFIDEKELIFNGIGYLYKEKDGDNTYYTEKITDNFYYYEGHF